MRIPKAELLSKQHVDEDLIRIKDYENMPMHMVDLSDEKAKSAFVGEIEALVRNSFEYKKFISFLKDHIDMNRCSYFKNLTRANKIKIEIHHEPFSLYDISYIVIQKFLDECEDLNEFKIAHEIMYMHYEGLIGLIPLSKLVHILVHAGEVFIPIDWVYGDIIEFYKRYGIYMKKEQKEILLRSIQLADMLKKPPEILRTKYTYLDVKGFELPAFIGEKRNENNKR